MTRAAALKAVRTMRAKHESRAKHRWKPSSSRTMEVMMEHKHKRMSTASQAVSHRHKRRKKKR